MSEDIGFSWFSHWCSQAFHQSFLSGKVYPALPRIRCRALNKLYGSTQWLYWSSDIGGTGALEHISLINPYVILFSNIDTATIEISLLLYYPKDFKVTWVYCDIESYMLLLCKRMLVSFILSLTSTSSPSLMTLWANNWWSNEDILVGDDDLQSGLTGFHRVHEFQYLVHCPLCVHFFPHTLKLWSFAYVSLSQWITTTTFHTFWWVLDVWMDISGFWYKMTCSVPMTNPAGYITGYISSCTSCQLDIVLINPSSIVAGDATSCPDVQLDTASFLSTQLDSSQDRQCPGTGTWKIKKLVASLSVVTL